MPASRPLGRTRSALHWLSWFHRWSGVAFCLAFAVWFAIGLVMVFVPFPALVDRDRLAGAEPLALSRLAMDPASALAAAGGGEALRLVSISGRPYYVATRNASLSVIDGESGTAAKPIDAVEAGAIAAGFGEARVRSVTGPLDYDQWVVHNKFDPWRPFYRLALEDAEGTVLYISARTGEVVQRTRAAERRWNWLGSVPHWLYFTALRQSFTAWDRTVWWLALAALASATAGTFLGIYRTYQRVALRRPGWSPFRGWLRWHHGLGLAAALFVLMWIFSGWLSMDHGRLFSRGVPDARSVSVYAGQPLQAALRGIPPTALSDLAGSTEIAFSVVGGRPVAVGRNASASRVKVLDEPVSGDLADTLAPELIARAAARAWPLAADRQPPSPSAALYRAADAIPANSLRFDLAHPKGAAIYIDAETGRPLVLLDSSRKAYAWAYLALHTTRFPGLVERPVLRRCLQMVTLLLGLAFTLTGVVVGTKRLLASMPKTNARKAG